jgi:hypothetical protein
LEVLQAKVAFGLKYFQMGRLLKVWVYCCCIYIAMLAVALAVCRCGCPDLAGSRTNVLAWAQVIAKGSQVFGEHPLTGVQRHTSTAYLTFVALGENSQPTEVPAIIPETEEEKRRYAEAQQRRKQRLKMRKCLPEES